MEEIKSRIDLLRDEKQILEQDIDRLKNEKIEEMSSLLSLKGVKEKFQKALDEIKLEVENMKNNLESLKKQHHAQMILKEKNSSHSSSGVLHSMKPRFNLAPSPAPATPATPPAPMKITPRALPLLTPKPPQSEPLDYKKYAAALNNNLDREHISPPALAG